MCQFPVRVTLSTLILILSVPRYNEIQQLRNLCNRIQKVATLDPKVIRKQQHHIMESTEKRMMIKMHDKMDGNKNTINDKQSGLRAPTTVTRSHRIPPIVFQNKQIGYLPNTNNDTLHNE